MNLKQTIFHCKNNCDKFHRNCSGSDCDIYLNNCKNGCTNISSSVLSFVKDCSKLHTDKKDIINCCKEKCIGNNDIECTLCDDLVETYSFPMMRTTNSDNKEDDDSSQKKILLFFIILAVIIIFKGAFFFIFKKLYNFFIGRN